MGKSKKPFIDKKNSSTYHLLYRSQRDVAEGGEGGVVLWPSPDNNKETDQRVLLGNQGALESSTLNEWKNELSKGGLVDDYDYEKHMKPITGTGDFFSSAGKRDAAAVKDVRSQDIREDITKEVDRQLDSIALTAECMDDEIANFLFGDVDFEEGDFEELNDEFVLDAAKEPEDEDVDGGFDFAAHIQGLMAKAKLEAQGGPDLGTIHEQGAKDQEFFSKSKPIGYDDDDDSGYFDEGDLGMEAHPGVAPKLSSAEEKALCDKFNETLLEYDSDDIGEGYDDDDVVGPLPLEGDAQIEAALDDYLQEKKDEVFMQGTRHYMEGENKGGSGFSALVGKNMVPVKNIDESALVDGITPINDVLGEADDILDAGKAAPPAEEIFIDGKSYFSEKMRNPWDCESILSTYSNLDNNPVTIGSGRRRKNKKKKKGGADESIAEQEEMQQILLSDKTGLPIGVLPSKDYGGGEDTFVSVNKGEARKKNETKEEKKARKLQVKKEREMARIQKKMMKEAFTDEFSKRAHDVITDDVGGKTVFRF